MNTSNKFRLLLTRPVGKNLKTREVSKMNVKGKKTKKQVNPQDSTRFCWKFFIR